MRIQRVALFFLLLLIPALSLSANWRLSPTMDEGSKLSSGYAYLVTGEIRTLLEHPILGKLIPALPLLYLKESPPEDVHHWIGPFLQPDQLIDPEKEEIHTVFFWCSVPLALMGLTLAWTVFQWSRALYGIWGGFLSLVLVALDPGILSLSGLVNNDLIVALFFLLTLYGLWRFAEERSVALLLLTGVFFGLAQATKFSALMLVPLVPLLLTVGFWDRGSREVGDSRDLLYRAKALFSRTLLPVTRYTAIIFLVGGFIVWTVHGFEVKYLKHLVWAYTAQPVLPMEDWPLFWSWIAGHLPVPASPYFQGLGEFFAHATSGHQAYLAGEFSSEGWWYYFPVAFVLKTPLPSLLLILAASFSVIRARGEEWRKDAFLWLPVLFYLLVSMGVSVNIGYRHILPVVPLLYLFAGRLLRSADREESDASASVLLLPRRALVAAVPVLWLALAAGSAWPHFLSYFNPLAGGPQGGHRWLLDSNIDWGQDLVSLKSWMEEKELVSVKLSYFGSVFPGAYYGIEYECLPTFGAQNREQCPGLREVEMEPGWYVVSVNHLHGLAIRGDPFAEFRRMKPVERIGNSMLVFQIDGASPR